MIVVGGGGPAYLCAIQSYPFRCKASPAKIGGISDPGLHSVRRLDPGVLTFLQKLTNLFLFSQVKGQSSLYVGTIAVRDLFFFLQ
jgi:hypothetical protein